MEEEDILEKITEQEKKLDMIYKSVKKIRTYFFWTLIVSIAVIILPIIALIIVIPKFLQILELGP
ncbi:hypothetical protein J7J23_02305 [bacterium]|nr:hypothetical protein [bacterium]